MTDYIKGFPILSPSSFQTARECAYCGADTTRSAVVITITRMKEPFDSVEVCTSCRNGHGTNVDRSDAASENKTEKDDS